jgi:8-oxo-dGTP diphosphatase
MTKTSDFTSVNLIPDKYDGITIDIATIPTDIKKFENELISILDNIKDKKLLWIKLPIEKSNIIPLLTKYDFVFHHCNEKDITMLKKLIDNAIVPTAINHTLGVGAVIIKENKLLVIKDKIWKQFKLPGGYIDDKENISVALQREVYEETGVKIELDSIVSIGHFYPSQFEKSNLYIVCNAKALSSEININDLDEIIEAKWMSLDEYFECEDIHEYNKNLVKTAIKNRGLKLEKLDYFANSKSQHEYYF